MPLQTALDRLADGEMPQLLRRLRNSRFGLLSHAPAHTRRGIGIIEALSAQGCSPSIVWGPEHGFHGFAQAEEGVEDLILNTPNEANEPAAEPSCDSNQETTGEQSLASDNDTSPDDDADSDESSKLSYNVDDATSEDDSDDATALNAEVQADGEESNTSRARNDRNRRSGGRGSRRYRHRDRDSLSREDAAIPRNVAPPSKFYSLYGYDKASLSPSDESLEGLEVIIIDLLDVGSRYYTYVWTALLLLRKAQAKNIQVIVLDRPNPIGGDPLRSEGRPQSAEYCSFVGLEPLPIRHSMTLGEVLVYFAQRDGISLGEDGTLTVISSRGWERNRDASHWGRPFVPPSPNMPSIQAAHLYPGACLIEGTTLSEGRGTTTPFQFIGAPGFRSDAVMRALRTSPMPGLWVRPTQFRPSFEKHAGQICDGLQLFVSDSEKLRPLSAFCHLFAAIRSASPEHLVLRHTAYEFEIEHPAIDLLSGGSEFRTALFSGASARELEEILCPSPSDWFEQVRQIEELVRSDAAMKR